MGGPPGTAKAPPIPVPEISVLVPVLNEVEYVERVTANGKRDLLVQRAIRGVLHCDFTPQEFSTAWIDLVGSMGFLDNLTIWTDTDCCSAPIGAEPATWGDLKSSYR